MGQELVGTVQTAGARTDLRNRIRARARAVVAVVAQVRRDPAERRGRTDPPKIVGQVTGERVRERGAIEPAGGADSDLSERDDVGVALGGVVDDRVEVDEPVVPGGVLVGRLGRGRRRSRVGVVRAVQRRVPAVESTERIRSTELTPGRLIAHVLVVVPPGRHVRERIRPIQLVELVRDRLHERRIDAAVPVHLAGVELLVRVEVAGEQIVVAADQRVQIRARAEAVAARLLGRRLARDLRDVVVEAGVAGGVVVLDELALLEQRGVEVGRRRSGAERRGRALVLELDDEDVPDRPGRERGPDDAAVVTAVDPVPPRAAVRRRRRGRDQQQRRGGGDAARGRTAPAHPARHLSLPVRGGAGTVWRPGGALCCQVVSRT